MYLNILLIHKFKKERISVKIVSSNVFSLAPLFKNGILNCFQFGSTFLKGGKNKIVVNKK